MGLLTINVLMCTLLLAFSCAAVGESAAAIVGMAAGILGLCASPLAVFSSHARQVLSWTGGGLLVATVLTLDGVLTLAVHAGAVLSLLLAGADPRATLREREHLVQPGTPHDEERRKVLFHAARPTDPGAIRG